MGKADYSLDLKREILKILSLQLPCCQKSFLTAILRGSARKPHIKTPKVLSPLILRFLKKTLPIETDLKSMDGKVFITGFNQRVLREKMVERLCRTSDPASVKHCHNSFLQGLFFSRGYIQCPSNGYHLELRLPGTWFPAMFRHICKQIKLRFNSYPTDVMTLFYLKNSKKIIRFLNTMGLFDKSLELSDLKATRRLLSMVNRQVNFETANINRLINAAEESITQIKDLLNHENQENQEILTDNLRQLALIRLKHPHDSLEALGHRFSPSLSKSAINHRLRRIKAVYKRTFGKKTEQL